jgi:hypothetical protein
MGNKLITASFVFSIVKTGSKTLKIFALLESLPSRTALALNSENIRFA